MLMRSIIAIALLTHVFKARGRLRDGELINRFEIMKEQKGDHITCVQDKLIHRGRNAWRLNQVGLDNTTLGKTRHRVACCNCYACNECHENDAVARILCTSPSMHNARKLPFEGVVCSIVDGPAKRLRDFPCDVSGCSHDVVKVLDKRPSTQQWQSKQHHVSSSRHIWEHAEDSSRDLLLDCLLKPAMIPKKRMRLESSDILLGGGGVPGLRGALRTATSNAEETFSPVERPNERLRDFGGINAILADIEKLVIWPLAHPEVYAHLGVPPPTGILLHGPPGTGKTKLVHAIAGTTGVCLFKIATGDAVSSLSGDSEAKIRSAFQAAIAAAPSLIFLDEFDALSPNRDVADKGMERRITAQLLTCIDDLRGKQVVVLAATNRPDSIDPAFRRPGRFDREIAMGIPDRAARKHILEKMTQGMLVAKDIDLAHLAGVTPGYVGADLAALTQEAASGAICRAFADIGKFDPEQRHRGWKSEPYSQKELSGIAVEMTDFRAAVGKVQPSAKREGFTTIPNVSWEQVGALADVRADLEAMICEPLRKEEVFRQFGLPVSGGVLLFGPPGCGKTLIAKATANACGANFIAVNGPELLNKWVGESEKAVREVFRRATASSPCVIFFDELDALTPRRSTDANAVTRGVVNQMLTEMDGVHQRSQVFVIGATNRPDILDPAILRPGRMDRLLFVPVPSEAGRLEILETHMRKMPQDADVDLRGVASGALHFSGADLAALAREAAALAIRGTEASDNNTSAVDTTRVRITSDMLARARTRVSPSVGLKERQEYEALAARYCSSTQSLDSNLPEKYQTLARRLRNNQRENHSEGLQVHGREEIVNEKVSQVNDLDETVVLKCGGRPRKKRRRIAAEQRNRRIRERAENQRTGTQFQSQGTNGYSGMSQQPMNQQQMGMGMDPTMGMGMGMGGMMPQQQYQQPPQQPQQPPPQPQEQPYEEYLPPGLRIDVDNVAYTAQQFRDEYGDAWRSYWDQAPEYDPQRVWEEQRAARRKQRAWQAGRFGMGALTGALGAFFFGSPTS